jgi:hypothetical protein
MGAYAADVSLEFAGAHLLDEDPFREQDLRGYRRELARRSRAPKGKLSESESWSQPPWNGLEDDPSEPTSTGALRAKARGLEERAAFVLRSYAEVGRRLQSVIGEVERGLARLEGGKS